MTDLIAAPTAATEKTVEASPVGDASTTAVLDGTTAGLPPVDGDQPLAWAPIEPAPKKKRLGLWIGLGVGAIVLGAGIASTVLIAPGTTIAGVPVGWMTAGAAADAVSTHLAQTSVTLSGSGDDVVVTGSELGAAIDARALADDAFSSNPMWNVTAWGTALPGTITLDTAKADAALRAAVPSSYVAPVDASVGFDAASNTYVVTPAVAGTEISIPELTTAITEGIADGSKSVEFSSEPAPALAAVSDEAATTVATSLNTMLGNIGFYVGDERTVAVDAPTAASWLKVVDANGELSIVADKAAIQATVDSLPGIVDRAPVNANTIVNSSGKVLRTETAGVNGRTVGDTSNVAGDFATQLETGNGAFALSVTETPFQTVNVVRKAEVNLSTQTATFTENGQVVNSWKISSGAAGHETKPGNFTIRAHVRIQDMKGADYLTKDVPWVTYFNGDQAFHGTYWHNNFGHVMSHGCVNMPISAAKWVYDWAPDGVEVSVHY